MTVGNCERMLIVNVKIQLLTAHKCWKCSDDVKNRLLWHFCPSKQCHDIISLLYFNFRGSILLDHPCIVSRLLFRSLHDLSCQFGTRGFTKQMRQIAGGSKAGLRKFLLQYPSLFAIQNDTVQVAKIPPRSKSVSYFELPKVIWGWLMLVTVVWSY